MNGDGFAPNERELISTLRRAPQARLAARTKDAIRQRMLAEMDAPTGPAPEIMRLLPARPPWLAAGLAAVLVLVVAGVVLLVNRPPDAVVVTTTAALTRVAAGRSITPEVSVPVVRSDTPTSTLVAPVEPSPTQSPELSDTPSNTSTVTATLTPIVTLTATPTVEPVPPSPTPETVIALEGPIERIDGRTITIYGIDVAVAAGNPILDIVEVGDIVRVEGGYDEQIGLVATLIENLLDEEADTATVGLDGPIEKIDGEFVTVNGIDLVLAPAAPPVGTLQVGDFLSVRGNIEIRGSRFVLVAVSVEVLPNVEIATPVGCYFHDAMGMGHWHCDGMGMGMGMESGGMGMEAP